MSLFSFYIHFSFLLHPLGISLHLFRSSINTDLLKQGLKAIGHPLSYSQRTTLSLRNNPWATQFSVKCQFCSLIHHIKNNTLHTLAKLSCSPSRADFGPPPLAESTGILHSHLVIVWIAGITHYQKWNSLQTKWQRNKSRNKRCMLFQVQG